MPHYPLYLLWHQLHTAQAGLLQTLDLFLHQQLKRNLRHKQRWTRSLRSTHTHTHTHTHTPQRVGHTPPHTALTHTHTHQRVSAHPPHSALCHSAPRGTPEHQDNKHTHTMCGKKRCVAPNIY